jgi:glycosyltransferase involved in cell wall biosynthesis
VESWQKIGIRVELVGGLPADIYRKHPVSIFAKIRRRWHMYIGYLGIVFGCLRKRGKFGAVNIVTTNPFFLPAFVQCLSSRQSINICLVYDLYPDTLLLNDTIRANTGVASILATITRYAFRRSAATVFLGQRLRRFAEGKYGPPRRSAVIAVGADGLPFRDSEPSTIERETPKIVLYAGNLGRMHDTATLTSLWNSYSHQKIVWQFNASGNGYSQLRKENGALLQKHNITFGDPLQETEWISTLKRCPVALVTLKPGAESLVMPSKVYSAMVAGQALLAVCAIDSDLGDLIRAHDCGWVIEPGDVGALSIALDAIGDDPESLQAKRSNSFEAGHRLYTSDALARNWALLIRELSDENSAIA